MNTIRQAVDQIDKAKKRLEVASQYDVDTDSYANLTQQAIAHVLLAIHYDLMALVAKR